MKSVECLVPGCAWHADAEESAELVRRSAEHLRLAHDEQDIRPRMVDAIKAHIHEKSETVH
jgi:predicted small metal-binding protein